MHVSTHAPEVEIPDADNASAPTLRMQNREWRTVLEFASTRLSGRLIDQWPRGDGHPVLVIPGFLTSGTSTQFLRGVLRRLGYQAHDWKAGRNLGPNRETRDALRSRVDELADRHGRPISVIGWSLGGVYAREIGRRTPDHVRQVITMGSPIRGNHRASRPARLYGMLNPATRHEDPQAEAGRVAREQPLSVPTTCIYSRTDGIVAWECCTSLPGPQTENVEVRSTHLGFGHNLETLYVIADRLAQPEGEWRPFNR